MAVASPPPMHSDAIPRFRSYFSSAASSVTITRAPDAPIGWPSAQGLGHGGAAVGILGNIRFYETGRGAQLFPHRSPGQRIDVHQRDLATGPDHHFGNSGAQARATTRHKEYFTVDLHIILLRAKGPLLRAQDTDRHMAINDTSRLDF
jgi:hypothetical protein